MNISDRTWSELGWLYLHFASASLGSHLKFLSLSRGQNAKNQYEKPTHCACCVLVSIGWILALHQPAGALYLP